MEGVFTLIGVFLGWGLSFITTTFRDRSKGKRAIEAIHLSLRNTRKEQLMDAKSRLQGQIDGVRKGAIHTVNVPFAFLTAFEEAFSDAARQLCPEQFLDLILIYQVLKDLKNNIENWPTKILTFDPKVPLSPAIQKELTDNIGISDRNLDRVVARIDAYLKKYLDN